MSDCFTVFLVQMIPRIRSYLEIGSLPERRKASRKAIRLSLFRWLPLDVPRGSHIITRAPKNGTNVLWTTMST